MNLFNALMRVIFAALLAPLSQVHPLWGLSLVALLTAVLALLIYRRASNQQAIRRAKDRMRGHLLEVRLYRDEGTVVARALLGMLANNARYLLHSLVPMLFLILPVLAILAQLNLWFGYRAPAPGGSVIVRAKFSGLPPPSSELRLHLPAGLLLDAPPLRIPRQNEIDWRLRAEKAGHFTLGLEVGGQPYAKTVTFADSLARLSPKATAEGAWQAFLFPGERALPKRGPLRRLETVYRPAAVSVFGWQMHWLIPFFILTMVFAFALKGLFRVEI